MTDQRITLERTYRASLEDVWALWTTKDGIESWWGPEGFRVEVSAIDVRVGGALVYHMIAATPEMVTFMQSQGMQASHEARLRYTEVSRNERLAYLHAADFIPGVPAYDVASSIDFHRTGDSVRMVLSFDPMHDTLWTERQRMGWESELRKLDKVLAS